MIERYSKKKISVLFTNQAKYAGWLEVELAVLHARVDMGTLEASVYEKIKNAADFICDRIDELEAVNKHDLLAFVECVQESLSEDRLKKHFHEFMTSYDTEEPATAMIMIAACNVILEALGELCETLKKQALKYRYTLKIGRTHGQHAQPITFGLELLWWYDALERQLKKLEQVCLDMEEAKISGGVGTYGAGLSPELERRTLEYLGLRPARISAQIILRDRHCRVLNELAILASLMEHIAINLRIYGQTEIMEVQEPFGKNQKGSSYMPHKKNTILTENLCGMASMVRGYAGMLMEKIPTWSARDIAHSSIERVAIPDAFELTNFMLGRLNGVIEGMEVHEDRMLKNLNLTKGAIFSPDVKEFLMNGGVDPEKAYRICQQAAFVAMKKDICYLEALREDSEFPVELAVSEELEKIFDPKKTLQYVDETFAKFGL